MSPVGYIMQPESALATTPLNIHRKIHKGYLITDHLLIITY